MRKKVFVGLIIALLALLSACTSSSVPPEFFGPPAGNDLPGLEWDLISEFSASDASVVGPLIEADSAAYAAENNIAARCN